MATGKSVADFPGHRSGVLCVAFSPDGQTLATAGADAAVKLWDVATRKELFTLKQHRGPVYSLAFSPDGKKLITSSHDQTVICWDAQTGISQNVFRGHGGPVFSTAFSPDGKLLATGGYSSVAKLWDTTTGLEKTSLRGHNRFIWAMVFSPDSQTLATAAWDGTVNLWNTTRGADFDILIPNIPNSDAGSYSVAFSPDGKTLATASGLMRFWKTDDLTEQLNFSGFVDPLVRYTGDGKSVVVADARGILKVFDAATKTEQREIQAATNKIWGLAVSVDSKTAAIGDAAGKVKLWNIETGTIEITLPWEMSSIRSLAFSPGGKTLAVLGSDLSKESVLCFWDISGQRIRNKIFLKFPAAFVVYSPDGKTFAISRITDTDENRANRIITLWDAQTETIRTTLPAQLDLIYDAHFSPDSKTLATASWDGSVRLWHVATGSELLTLKGQTKGVMFCVAFSPDGRQLVGGCGRDVTGSITARWLAEAKSAAESASAAPTEVAK